MAGFGARTSTLRVRHGHDHHKVAFVELFFDLVFVFAVTQLSHHLLAHPGLAGAAETLLLFMAVWWVWIYTSWVTNWLDPARVSVRLLLFALMLAGLVLSSAIPEAFGAHGLYFAAAYVVMQVGRAVFMLWALRHHHPRNFRNFQRIAVWAVAAGLFWLGGGLADGEARIGLWLAGLALDYLGPAQGFRVPGLGRSATTDWDVEGGHMAERCGLFLIIALGESILAIGATFGGHDWTPGRLAAFLSSFLGSVALWWLYFNHGAERGSHRISDSSDPGRQARLAYTYFHLPLIAGIVVTAVGDDLILGHPDAAADSFAIGAVLGGPALYLVGTSLFKWTAYGRLPLSHLAGLVLLAALLPVAPLIPALAFGAAATLVLVVLAAWESLALRAVPD